MIAAVLSQKHPDRTLRPIGFMIKKILPAEYNYEIYDKKLLAIICAFKKWRPELAKTPTQDPIHVITDYKNLKYFMTFKNLDKKQAF